MNKQLTIYTTKLHAMTLRERQLITISIVAVFIFLFWNFFAEPIRLKTDNLKDQNANLEREIKTLLMTSESISRGINQGVNNTKQQQLQLLNQDLVKVNTLLKQMTLELIEPDEMFELMQQLIFAESKLKLTGLKRKQVLPAFSVKDKSTDQPEIYRHVMQMSFEGSYENILNYIVNLEQTEWKLIWDSITLKTADYPMIKVDIKISTLSDGKHWVGL
jgi:hypothetical protein